VLPVSFAESAEDNEKRCAVAESLCALPYE
jgi:hypothetical protein